MAQAISASAQRAATRRRQKASGGGSRTGRKRAGGGRSSIRWDRVARAALLGTLGIVLLLYISPLHRWITQHNLAKQQNAELQQLEKQNKDLKAHIKLLHDPSALEAEARKLGMIRRGEREYVVRNLPDR